MGSPLGSGSLLDYGKSIHLSSTRFIKQDFYNRSSISMSVPLFTASSEMESSPGHLKLPRSHSPGPQAKTGQKKKTQSMKQL